MQTSSRFLASPQTPHRRFIDGIIACHGHFYNACVWSCTSDISKLLATRIINCLFRVCCSFSNVTVRSKKRDSHLQHHIEAIYRMMRSITQTSL